MPEWHGPRNAAGREHGRGAEVFDNGRKREEGESVDGVRQGRWVETSASSGWRYEGAYVDGLKHGPWVETRPDGTRSEGLFLSSGQVNADGRNKHGLWVTSRPDGTTWQQQWHEGKAVGGETVRASPPPPPPPPHPPARPTGHPAPAARARQMMALQATQRPPPPLARAAGTDGPGLAGGALPGARMAVGRRAGGLAQGWWAMRSEKRAGKQRARYHPNQRKGREKSNSKKGGKIAIQKKGGKRCANLKRLVGRS